MVAQFGMVLLVLVSIGAVVATALLALDLCSDGRMLAGACAGAVSMLLLAGLLTCMLIADRGAMSQCLESGGAWAATGRHAEVVYDPSLKMALPREVTDYGCIQIR